LLDIYSLRYRSENPKIRPVPEVALRNLLKVCIIYLCLFDHRERRGFLTSYIMRVGVIGAGPAGMTAAYELSKKGVHVDVFEASGSVGGMAKTIPLWNQRVDLGPHRFFSSDPRVNSVWKEIVGDDYDLVDRLTRIYYGGRFFYYPLKMFNALSQLGIIEGARCFASLAGQSLSRKQISENGSESFEDWVVERFGRRLFEIFFKTYTEKLWGLPCSSIDADFAAQRIKKLSLIEAGKSAVMGNKNNKHKTLLETFAYPHEGTGVIYERMADRVRELGGSVFLDRPVKRVLADKGKATGVELMSGETLDYDHIISTMPLSRMVEQLPGVPEDIKQKAKSLKFRNTILVYLKVEASDLFPDQWLYIHDESLRTGRITNFRNWSEKLYGNETSSILVLEYWCYRDEPIWSDDDSSLIELAKSEIRKTGLIGETAVSDGHVVRLPNCYPVYGLNYRSNLKPVEDYLGTISNLTAIGRYGAFKYNNQDHSILMGILAAHNITEKANHDLWQINTDYEYQESASVTQTGLKKAATSHD
jgi:protoporphyrinogen oxidase